MNILEKYPFIENMKIKSGKSFGYRIIIKLKNGKKLMATLGQINEKLINEKLINDKIDELIKTSKYYLREQKLKRILK